MFFAFQTVFTDSLFWTRTEKDRPYYQDIIIFCLRGLLQTKHVLIEQNQALLVEIFKVWLAWKELFVSLHFKMSFNEKEQKFVRTVFAKIVEFSGKF